ncbi:synaptotagmin-1 [Bactrocera neohumeralis]|uniref:synaptotagmin-1 n=1 Tax=Bactrocera neohumeralis TaxID=98809 RepID=UPI0021669F2C|nr:synaptotagmin-1 [Bactrocera neohumeralis]
MPALSNGRNMDIVIREEDVSVAQVGIYASISFLVVTVVGALFYVSCSKKYRLNWFEKNLLESAAETQDTEQCTDPLVAGTAAFNADNISECSRSRSICKGNVSPTSINTDDPTFWVPPPRKTVQQQVSTSAEESPPPTPTSPTGSLKSNTLSMSSTSSVPITRSDKHVVLGMNPSRPKVASMSAKLDHTKIDMSLYRSNSQQKGSPQGSDDIRGNIHLSVVYDTIAGMLSVHLIEAQNLQPRDFSRTADPYAKVRLLPEKKNFWQTRIHKKTLNPIFDEDFVFEENASVIDKRTIEILLYDFDAYSRHVCIGGAQIPLNSLDLSEKVELWTPLGSCAEQDMKVDLGDIMVSLSFLPSAERLTVVLIKARNLRIIDDSRNSSDPYIKVALLSDGKKIKKRKTGVTRNTINPVYNEALTFDVNKDTLKNCLIEFTVVHDGLLGSSEILGRAVIGNSAEVRPEERMFFEQMFRSKNSLAQWVPLQEASNQRGTLANPPTNVN